MQGDHHACGTARSLGRAAAAALSSRPPRPPTGGGRTPTPVVRSDQLAAPFNLAVSAPRRSTSPTAALNLVGKLKRDGTIKTIAADQPGASGVAPSRTGRRLAFTTTVTNMETFENTASGLQHLGSARQAGVRRHARVRDRRRTPTRSTTTASTTRAQCVHRRASRPPASRSPTQGASTRTPTRWRPGPVGWVVADAGANALLRVRNEGQHPARCAVLPPQPATITAEAAAALGLPDCVVGVTYAFEPVPTDVEVGQRRLPLRDHLARWPGDRRRSAPGASCGRSTRRPAGPGRGRRAASSARPTWRSGRTARSTSPSCSPARSRWSSTARSRPYVTLPGVVAVETGSDGTLWAGTLGNEDPPAPGTIVKIRNGHVHH